MTYLPARARLLDIDAEVLIDACNEYEKYAQLGDGFHESEYSREHEADLAHNIAERTSVFAQRVHDYVDLDSRAHGHALILEAVKAELHRNAEDASGLGHEPSDLAVDVISRLATEFLAREHPVSVVLGIGHL